jgi:rubrerythrin
MPRTRRFPLHLRLPQAAFRALEIEARKTRQTVETVAAGRILRVLVDEDQVWICPACGHVLSVAIPATHDPECGRGICPACVSSAGIIEG